MRSIFYKKSLIIRFPNSTRPWQHVLEALYGYMILALKQKNNKNIVGNVFNFGPNNRTSIKVIDLIKRIKSQWNILNWRILKSKKGVYESKLLKLNSDKAHKILKWKCFMNADETINMVVNWYKFYFDNKNKNMYDFSIKQIKEFENLIKSKK